MCADEFAHYVVGPFVGEAFLLETRQLVAQLLKTNSTVPIQFFIEEVCVDATNFLGDIARKFRTFHQFGSIDISSNRFYHNRPQRREIVTRKEHIDSTGIANSTTTSVEEIS